MEDFLKVIKGCIDKNRRYQQVFYEQYRGYAFKIVFRYIYTQENAAEVVNDGFVKLFNNIEKFEMRNGVDGEKLLMGWLKKIMINISVDRLRREKLNLETSAIPETAWQLPDDAGNAAEILFYNDLVTLIKELPSAYRLAFNLHVIDGYPHTEIAHMLNIPVSTSRSNLLRARAMLQKSIIKLEDNQRCSM